MPEAYWYFKLFNSIKEKHEIEFAELELNSLFGNVNRVRNFADLLEATPFSLFRDKPARVQDLFAHELPYGEYHGFSAKTDAITGIPRLVKRLTYTREFYLVVENDNVENTLQQMLSTFEKGKNFEYFKSDSHVLMRFITNQYFLEKSQYISKLSRNEREASDNVERLLSFLTKATYRIPATETMQVGKRLEDYFTVREEPSLYLTHYMHPYKGKFHPKMVRALLNYIFPREPGTIMDNFAGCGTLLVEATWMGLDSIGIEINPLSALMSNVKCASLKIAPEDLKASVDEFMRELHEGLLALEARASGSALLIEPKYSKEKIQRSRANLPPQVFSLLNNPKIVDQILLAHELVKKVEKDEIHDFLLLALSGTISDLARRRRGEFEDVLRDRLRNLYLRIHIFSRLNQVLRIRLGNSRTYAVDTRNMNMIGNESVDAIINSPPYSTALDYIKNDYPQLVLLELADVPRLETNMIGNPQFKVYPKSLLDEIVYQKPYFAQLPENAKNTVSSLVEHGRTKEAMRTYKFFKDMLLTLKEMHRVLKHGAKCAIIVGNNHYKLDGKYAEVKNDDILKQAAQTLGFKEDKTITRELEKTRAGMIRSESILILEKP
jgi:tRNA G10  N-methylase Trm11